jgi:N-acetylneuraminic acid mutarotase
MKKSIYLLVTFLLLTVQALNAQNSIEFKKLADMSEVRHSFAYCNDGRFIYAIDGTSFSFKGNMGNVERYDPKTNKWTMIINDLIPRKWANAEYLPSENKIYVFNGQFKGSTRVNIQPERFINSSKSDFSYTRRVEVIDLIRGKVTTGTDIPNPVEGSGSAVWDNKIYVFGGSNPRGFTASFYVYDPVEDKWSELPEMPVAKRTTGEFIDGVLYTFGGYGKRLESSIDAYDLKTGKWSHVGELPEGLESNGITSDGQNIWLVGSYPNIKFFASFNGKTRTITKYDSNNWTPARNLGASVMNNTLYIFGGIQTEEKSTILSRLEAADLSKFLK